MASIDNIEYDRSMDGSGTPEEIDLASGGGQSEVVPKPFLLVPCDPRLVGFILGKNRVWLKKTGEQAKTDGIEGAFIAWLPPRDHHYGCFKVTAANQDGVNSLYELVKAKEKHGLELLENGKFIPRRPQPRQDRGGYDDRRQDRGGYDDRRGNDDRGQDRGGYDDRRQDRGGYDDRHQDRRGYDNRRQDRRGYDNRRQDRRGYDNRRQERRGYDNRRQDRQLPSQKQQFRDYQNGN